MKKLMIICFYEAYPPRSGAASVTYNVARYAKGNVTLVQMGDALGEQYVDGISVVTLPAQSASRWAKLFGLFDKVRLILDLIRDKKPNVIVLEGASWVLYHLFLLRRIRKFFSNLTIVYHAHNVEYILRKQKHGAIVTSITKYCEGAILRNADLNFAVSEVDAGIFADLYGVYTEVLPNAVDVSRFSKVSDADVAQVKSKYRLCGSNLLFMGSYAYLPNKQGLDFIVKQVMPIVLAKRPEMKLVVLGNDSLPHEKPWVMNLGQVDHEELPAIVKACHIGLAPIFSGSGTRLKILEYMAAGLPVISTRKGAEGLEVRDTWNILLAEDSESFARCVAALMNHEEKHSIGLNGQAMIFDLYSWDSNMERFSERLRVMKDG